MNYLHFAHLPRGQMEWANLLTALSATDDRAERHFLELKSEVDLTVEGGRAKVAKFILGASNRFPEAAARYFDGHAVMILGIKQGAVTGIGPFEAMDLAKTVQKFAGIPGPGWDFHRIPVDPDHDVIAIVVDPPLGTKVWTCLKDGPEGLFDGTIYIRADGETRKAKGEEIRALLDRVQAPAENVDFSVSVVGPAISYTPANDALNEYIQTEKDRLLEFLRNGDTDITPAERQTAFHQSLPGLHSAEFQTPETRTQEEYMIQINKWEEESREAWPTFLDHVAAAAGRGTHLRVRNLSSTFMEDVEVTIHIEGEIETLNSVGEDEFDALSKLPSPPRPWGPKLSVPNWLLPHMFTNSPLSDSFLVSPPNEVQFRNGGSTDLILQIKELRPKGVYDSDDGEFMLVARKLTENQGRGTWRITARGHHRVYEGVLEKLSIREFDFTHVARSILRRESDEPNKPQD